MQLCRLPPSWARGRLRRNGVSAPCSVCACTCRSHFEKRGLWAACCHSHEKARRMQTKRVQITRCRGAERVDGGSAGAVWERLTWDGVHSERSKCFLDGISSIDAARSSTPASSLTAKSFVQWSSAAKARSGNVPHSTAPSGCGNVLVRSGRKCLRKKAQRKFEGGS